MTNQTVEKLATCQAKLTCVALLALLFLGCEASQSTARPTPLPSPTAAPTATSTPARKDGQPAPTLKQDQVVALMRAWLDAECARYGGAVCDMKLEKAEYIAGEEPPFLTGRWYVSGHHPDREGEFAWILREWSFEVGPARPRE